MRLAAARLALLAVMALGVAFGTEPISLVARARRSRVARSQRSRFDVRLPRVLLGGVAGGGLAIVGVAFQAILRNPLAEPYMLGVSGGAALGATVAIVVGADGADARCGASLFPLAAFAGGLGATALVYALARVGSGVSAPGQAGRRSCSRGSS